MGQDIQELTRESFPDLVGKAEKPVRIDFWGPQCRPCLALAPTFEQLAEAHDEMIFLKAAAPSNRMLCVDLQVMGLPTFLCMVDGKEVSRLTGGDVSAEQLKEWVGEQAQETKGVGN